MKSRRRVAVLTACLSAGVAVLAAGLFFRLRAYEAATRFAKEQQLPDTAKVVSATWSTGKTGNLLLSATIQLSRADGDLFCGTSGARLVQLRPEGPHSWSDALGQGVGPGAGETARAVTVNYLQGVPGTDRGASLQVEGFSSIPVSPSDWWAGLLPTRPRRHQLVRYRLTAPPVRVPASPSMLASRSP